MVVEALAQSPFTSYRSTDVKYVFSWTVDHIYAMCVRRISDSAFLRELIKRALHQPSEECPDLALACRDCHCCLRKELDTGPLST